MDPEWAWDTATYIVGFGIGFAGRQIIGGPEWVGVFIGKVFGF